MARNLKLAISILNGAVGDYLARRGNGLATEMAFIHRTAPVPLDRASLSRLYPDAGPRIAVLVHGIMCTEDIWAFADGSDYGSLLARDHGFTPLYVRYNSGLAIPDNGAALARLLGFLGDAWPVPIAEIVPIGFSMGGLVIRNACHVGHTGGHGWLGHVDRAVYLGTPHRGAPMERVGRVVSKMLRAVPDPYTRLVADIADLRSDGIKDLGDADVRHEDRARRLPRVALRDPRHPVPLLPRIRHHLVAGALVSDPHVAAFFGDSIVPLPSATDGREVDLDVKVFAGVSHVTLAHHPDVYAHIRDWCRP